jgi:hypothetical protein
MERTTPTAFVTLLLFGLVVVLSASAHAQSVTVTAKLVKAEIDTPLVDPAVRLVADSSGCILYNEPGYWDENAGEFYFSVRVPAENQVGPVVEVDMKGAPVDRVLVPHDEEIDVQSVNGKLRFRLPKKAGNLLSVVSRLHQRPNLNIIHFWNARHRRAGLYAEPEPWPHREILAHMSYKFAAKQAFRFMDMSDHIAANFPGQGYANASGFETNYPEQHKDYPPHIHLWFQWPNWKGYVTHYYMDRDGRITACSVTEPDGNWSQLAPDTWLAAEDSTGQAVFYTRYTSGGALEIKKRLSTPVYQLRLDDLRRARILRGGTTIAEIKLVEYDPLEAKIVVHIIDYLNRKRITEKVIADPDLGTVQEHTRNAVSI